MKIKSLSVQNYTSIRELSIPFSDEVNVLIGPNGCGKTNILMAINNCFHVAILGRSSISEHQSCFGSHGAIEIKASIEHLNEELNVSIRFEYKDKEGHRPVAFCPQKPASHLIGYYRFIASNRDFSNSNIVLSNERNLESIFNENNFRAENTLLDYANMSISSPARLDEISEVVSKVFPHIEKIYVSYVDNRQAELLVVVNGFAFQFHRLASGLKELLSMIVTIYFSKNSVIVIDEPELHMNPRMVIALSNLINTSARKNDNQFILGTHSSALISTPGFKTIPIEYAKTESGYFTVVAEKVPEEFVARPAFLKES